MADPQPERAHGQPRSSIRSRLRRRLGGRWPRRLALALIALELVYLVAGNVFLRSEAGMGVMNRRPEKVRVGYQSAWTPLPGLVRVSALELGGESRRVRWRTTIDRAWTWIWIPSLALQHVRIVSATPSGVDLDIEILPPSEEPRRPGRGWKVTLGGLRTDDLRRLRVDEYEIVSDGELRGWIQFQVRGPLELDVDRLRFEDGVLRRADRTLAERLRLEAELTTEPWRAGQQPLDELIEGTSGRLALGARVESVGFLAGYLRRLPWLGLGGSGDLALDVEVERGSLLPGSALTVEGDQIFADLFDLRATGRGRIAGTVEPEPQGVRLGASLSEFSVARSSDGAALFVGEELESIVTIESTALHRPPEDVAGAIRLASARAQDLSRFGPYFPAGLALVFERGQAELSLDLAYDTGARSGSGDLEIALRDVAARYADARIVTSGRIDVELPALDLVSGRFDLDGTRIELEGGRIEHRDEVRSDDWSARLVIPAGTLELPPRDRDRGTPAPRATALTADLEVVMSDSAPVVAIMEQRLPKLRFVDGLLTMKEVELTGRVEARGDRLGLHGIEVSGGEGDQLTILMDLDLAGADTRGAAYARWRALDAAVVLDEGERDWGFFRSRRKYDQALAEQRARRGEIRER
jgi:hypothetical protein